MRRGSKLSPETLAKIGVAQRGKRLSPETRAKISATKLWYLPNMTDEEIAAFKALRSRKYRRDDALTAIGRADLIRRKED